MAHKMDILVKLATIKAVGIDCSGIYQAVVKERCPQAAIVYDKFHLIAI